MKYYLWIKHSDSAQHEELTRLDGVLNWTEARERSRMILRQLRDNDQWPQLATILEAQYSYPLDLKSLHEEFHKEWQQQMEKRVDSPEALAAERAAYERLKAKFEPNWTKFTREETDPKEYD